jgi:hypothetical protein
MIPFNTEPVHDGRRDNHDEMVGVLPGRPPDRQG